MSALTSLLVRDHVVPVKKIEEAIQRQVISGGELDTVLLELGAVPENVASAYVAATVGLAPASREEVMGVGRDVVRLVPREVAEQHRLVPIAADGQTLTVASGRPLSAEAQQQLEFLLGMDLAVKIAPDVRIAAALAQHYAIEPTPRMRRLAERLSKQEPGELLEVAPYEANAAQRPDERRSALPGAKSPYSRPPVAASSAPSVKPAPTPVNAAPAAVAVTAPVRVLGSIQPAAAAPAVVPAEAPKNAAPPHRTFSPLAASTGATVHGTQPAIAPAVAPAEAPPPRSELVKRHRGPMSAQNAVDLLAKAESRDDILAVSFAFLRQFFDYTVMFVVHDELAEGLDAFGSGAPWQKVQKVSGSLAEPGVLRQVAELLVPRISQLDESDADRRFARDLERAELQPCILLPVTIRQRVVVLFYGDRGGEDFGLSDVPELLGFLPRVSEALQRLILQRKKRGGGGGGGGSGRPGGGGWPSATGAPPKASAAPPAAGATWGKARGVEGGPRASSASGEASNPAPSAPTGGAAKASEASPSERAGRPRRSGHFDVIGVPRSAPPPPMVGEVIAPSDPPPETLVKVAAIPAPGAVPEVDVGHVRGRAASTSAQDIVVGVPFDEATAAADDELPVERGAHAARPIQQEDDPADDEPELIIGEADSGEVGLDDEEAEAFTPRPAGAYRHRGGFVDVVTPKKPAPRLVAARRPEGNARARRAPSSAASDDDSGEEAGEGPRSREPDRGGEGPRSRGPGSEPSVEAVPKVIVSMGDSVEALVQDLRRASPASADDQVARVLDVGSAALPVLVQAFPGPLWHRRQAGEAASSAPGEVSAIARALASFGDRAVPYLLSLFDHESVEVRYYALVTASDLAHRDLVAPLSARLFDPDDDVAALAVQLLRKHRRFQREYQEALDRVRSTARSPRVDARSRALALEALGELRDARSLRVLLQFLDQGPPPLSRAAHQSLVALTRQDFGDSSKRWQPWVDENASKNRIEWLIDALLHVDEAMRRAAGDELKQLTQEYYGYHPALPRREREIAQRKYRAWWEAEGQRRFATP
jgi:hypothetical protein